MKKFKVLLILAVSVIIAGNVLACTNFLITKKASQDGSIIVTYAADSHQLFGALYYWPAADWKEGSDLDIYEWDTGKHLGVIKQVAHTYQVIGNMNEHQVIIGETTYGGLEELESQPGAIMDYGSLIYVALQRSKTAREAIKVISELMDQYGYASSGESFSIADKNEIWIMEMIGKGRTYKITNNTISNLQKAQFSADLLAGLKKLTGKEYFAQKEFETTLEKNLGKKVSKEQLATIIENCESSQKGAVWVAMQIPDGYVTAHANQARITTFPFQKTNNWTDVKQNVYHSADVIAFARKKGFYTGEDKDFSFSDTYAPVDFGGARFCEARVWSFFKNISTEIKNNKTYFEYAKGNVTYSGANNYASNRMPLWIKPDKQITLHEVMNQMRDHLEGTELDMHNDIGAGPFKSPYRWRPMNWKVDGVAYCHERVTATQQTGFSFVAQARSEFPDPIGGIFWFGVDDAASCVYTPIYCGSKCVPPSYKEGNGSMISWSDNCAFWIFNQVTNLAYTKYKPIHSEINDIQQSLEKKYIDYTPVIDQAAKTLYEKDQKLGIQFITDYSVNTAEALVSTWKRLYQYLFMKYVDGNVKKSEGWKLKDNGNGKNIPPSPEFPGYDDEFYRQIIKENPEKFKVHGGGH